MNSHDEQGVSHEYDADVKVLLRRLWTAIKEYVVEDISMVDYLNQALQAYKDQVDYHKGEYYHPLNLYFDVWDVAQSMRVGGPLKVRLEALFDVQGESMERQSWMELTANYEPLLHSLQSHFNEQDSMYELGSNILSEFTDSPGQWDVHKLECQLSDAFKGLPDLVFELQHYVRMFAKAVKMHGNQSNKNDVPEGDNISSNVGMGENGNEQQDNPTEVGASNYPENLQLQQRSCRGGAQSDDVADNARGVSVEATTETVGTRRKKRLKPSVMTMRYKLRDRTQNSK